MKNKGLSIYIGPNYCELSQKGLIATRLYKDNLILFETDAEAAEFASIANIATSENILHRRMDHVGNIALNALFNKTIGIKSPISNIKECETCV